MTAPEASAIGGLVREWRVRRGWTQEELAEQAGISPRSVSDRERGIARSHYPNTLSRLADTLGLEGENRAIFEAAVRGPRQPGSHAQVTAAAVLTFLIADVRGYTRFTTERGDEAGARLAARFAEIADEVIRAHEGDVRELRGDEALCVFPSARNALRCSLALQAAFARATGADPALPLLVGMGPDACLVRTRLAVHISPYNEQRKIPPITSWEWKRMAQFND